MEEYLRQMWSQIGMASREVGEAEVAMMYGRSDDAAWALSRGYDWLQRVFVMMHRWRKLYRRPAPRRMLRRMQNAATRMNKISKYLRTRP